MIEETAIAAEQGEYEEKRLNHKLNNFQMFTMFVKSTIGISVFAYQYVFRNSGIPMGLAFSAVFMTAVIYGIMRIVDFAAEVEMNSNTPDLQVNNYSDLCAIVLPNMPRFSKFLGPAVLAIIFFSNFGYCISSIITLDTTIQETLRISHTFSLLIILVGCTLVVLVILEPEKLVYFAFFTISVVLLLFIISFTCGSIRLFAGDFTIEDSKSITLDSMLLSCGFVVCSLEIVNFILNMRRMMRNKSQFTRVGYSSLAFCGMLFIIPSLTLHVTYGKQLENIDLYYKLFSGNIFVKVLTVSMCSVFVYHIIVNCICSIELLEKLKFSQTLLRDSDQNLSSIRILACRLVFLFLSVAVAYFVTDMQLVLAFIGLFLNTIIGLMIPGFIGMFRPAAIKRHGEGIFFRFADGLIFAIGIILILAYFVAKLI